MGTSLIFPAPKCDYTISSLQPFYHSIKVSEELVSNKRSGTKTTERNIPALYIKAGTKSKYLMIYFHGNCEDLGRSYRRLLEYYEHFQIDIIAPEYPGYGLYKGKTSARKIIEDGQYVIEYVTKEDGLNYALENIIVLGRSLGTGVAIQLAAKYPALKSMILISAYTSVRDIACRIAGSFSKMIIPNIFQSLETIKGTVVPTLFIHGKRDEVIPDTHSIKLFESCSSAKKKLELREAMDHNRCKTEKDIFEPIERFLIEDLQIPGLESSVLNLQNVAEEVSYEEDLFEITRRKALRFEKTPKAESTAK